MVEEGVVPEDNTCSRAIIAARDKEEQAVINLDERPANPLFADKAKIREIVNRVNAEIGFVPDPAATAEKAQKMMLDAGIRPEDNLASCGIIAARDEE